MTTSVDAFVRNPVSKRLRRIYCCSGAEFCRPDLEAAWKEIERLTRFAEGIRDGWDCDTGANGTHPDYCRKCEAERLLSVANAHAHASAGQEQGETT